ncbi:MAG: TerC/Alx family metal homeostasis membrane protein [Gammaproteobacteria bacterium]|nr:TerC/Alx family metal homeostasis membrane protein [Gammaproteobacteria bacterium]
MVIWLWTAFLSFIALMLVFDLGVLNRQSRIITFYEALAWTAVWVMLALGFTAVVYFLYQHQVWGINAGGVLSGQDAALQFVTAYLIEKSLSIDNIFVIALVFGYFHVPLEYQHRVLFWGVLTAIVLRGAMIFGGLALLHAFEWITYIFGAFLLYTAVKMLVAQHDQLRPEHNPLIRVMRRWLPVTADYHGEHFFIRDEQRKRVATPLLLALIMVESADIIFAVDSIPAVIAVTRDPFLVFTSNIFAILGLRSLYFALATMIQKLRYIKISLVFLLVFIGLKMLLAGVYQVPTELSLIIIVAILAVGVIASVAARRQQAEEFLSPMADELQRMFTMTYYNARRVVILVTGSTVVLAGLVMIVAPGPAILVIPLGLSILATEFIWARHLLNKFKENADHVTKPVRGFFSRLFRRGK